MKTYEELKKENAALVAQIELLRSAMLNRRLANIMGEMAWLRKSKAKLQDIIEKLQPERDTFAAKLLQLNKLHSDLTNADMVTEDGELMGYLVTHEQLCEFESYLSDPPQCLADVRAEAGRAGYLEGFAFRDKLGLLSKMWPTQEIIELADEYAECVKAGKAGKWWSGGL